MKAHGSLVPTHTQLMGRVLGVTGDKPPPHFLVLGSRPSNGPPSPSLDEETLRGREEPQVPTSKPGSISVAPHCLPRGCFPHGRTSRSSLTHQQAGWSPPSPMTQPSKQHPPRVPPWEGKALGWAAPGKPFANTSTHGNTDPECAPKA